MNSPFKCSSLCFIAIFLFVTCCLSFAAGDVRIVKWQHPQPVKQTLRQAGKWQVRGYGQQSTINSTKSAIHNARITFNEQLKNSSGIYFVDDMENGVNGWTVNTSSDTLWHQTTYDNVSPTHSWWCAVESTAKYNTGSRVNQSLISPAISLTGYTLPIHLLFNEEFGTEWGKDFCTVGVSTDGGVTWNELRSDTNSCSGNTGGWIITDFDLSEYANLTINIRFHFDTGDELSNDYSGWLIDNMIVFTGGRVGGVTYFDINQNGRQDTLEPPLDDGDWKITASGSLFTVSTWPDDQGRYSFTLPAGSYTLTEAIVPGWTPISPSSGSWQIALASPESVITANFGNWHPGAVLSGYVFNDANFNGIQDSSETLVPHQRINIYGPSYDDFRYTDGTGHYTFVVIDTGEYHIVENGIQFGTIQTFPPDGADYEIFVHDLSTNVSDLRFGVYYLPPYGRTCAIGGWIFNDLNRNGVRDGGEPGLGGIEVYLSGRPIISDSSGHYSFDSLYPGSYNLEVNMPPHWAIISPPSHKYHFDIPGGIKIDTANFGEAPSTKNASISGWLFHDRNRNSVRDGDEPGLAGLAVYIGGDVDSTTVSDSTGHYSFDSLYPGYYSVWANKPPNWVISSPGPSVYSFNLPDGKKIDTANFGEFSSARDASVSGQCFNDANKNGARDQGELGIGVWTITLTGIDHDRHFYQRQVITDSSGNYSIDSLWVGTYLLNQSLRSCWVQTLPPGFRPIIVTLDSANETSADFGDSYDSTFSIGFRSFISDSLALAKSYDGKKFGQPIKKLYVTQALFRTAFTNKVTPVAAATGLQITFKYPFIDSLVVVPPAAQAYDETRTSAVLNFPNGLLSGQTVQIQGVCTGPKPGSSLTQGVKSAVWTFPDRSKNATRAYLKSTPFRYVKPNAVDMLMAMAGYTVQIGVPLGRYSPHTVLMRKYTDITKSLVDSRGNMHMGSPTCLSTYTSGASIKKMVYYLPPSKQDNRLFAEAVALKVSILASELSITPYGFGDLIFDEGGDNPFNGKSISFIAGVLDQYMSSYRDTVGCYHCQISAGYEWFDSLSLYHTIRKIDSAFCGPIDYTAWIPGSYPLLKLTAVRSVADIHYIHIDSSFCAVGKNPPVAAIPEPDLFDLLQNYPNPFNPSTTISFTLPQAGSVTLKIYNALGQEVATLLNREQMDEGEQEVLFNASSLASGIYYYRLVIEGIPDEDGVLGQSYTAVKKMVLLK